MEITIKGDKKLAKVIIKLVIKILKLITKRLD